MRFLTFCIILSLGTADRTRCGDHCCYGYYENNEGVCLECPAGFYGRDCDTPCSNSYGPNCAYRCSCPEEYHCNPKNGSCTYVPTVQKTTKECTTPGGISTLQTTSSNQKVYSPSDPHVSTYLHISTHADSSYYPWSNNNTQQQSGSPIHTLDLFGSNVLFFILMLSGVGGVILLLCFTVLTYTCIRRRRLHTPTSNIPSTCMSTNTISVLSDSAIPAYEDVMPVFDIENSDVDGRVSRVHSHMQNTHNADSSVRRAVQRRDDACADRPYEETYPYQDLYNELDENRYMSVGEIAAPVDASSVTENDRRHYEKLPRFRQESAVYQSILNYKTVAAKYS